MKSVHDLVQENFAETFKLRPSYRADYDKFDEFVEAMFGVPFEIVADQELNNDTSWVANVGPKYPLNEYGLQDVNKFLTDGGYDGLARQLMQYMYERGFLMSGEYIIDVSY